MASSDILLESEVHVELVTAETRPVSSGEGGPQIEILESVERVELISEAEVKELQACRCYGSSSSTTGSAASTQSPPSLSVSSVDLQQPAKRADTVWNTQIAPTAVKAGGSSSGAGRARIGAGGSQSGATLHVKQRRIPNATRAPKTAPTSESVVPLPQAPPAKASSESAGSNEPAQSWLHGPGESFSYQFGTKLGKLPTDLSCSEAHADAPQAATPLEGTHAQSTQQQLPQPPAVPVANTTAPPAAAPPPFAPPTRLPFPNGMGRYATGPDGRPFPCSPGLPLASGAWPLPPGCPFDHLPHAKATLVGPAVFATPMPGCGMGSQVGAALNGSSTEAAEPDRESDRAAARKLLAAYKVSCKRPPRPYCHLLSATWTHAFRAWVLRMAHIAPCTYLSSSLVARR